MTAAIILTFAQLAIAAVAVAFIAARRGIQRRLSFDATVARHHPDLRMPAPLTGDLGVVAARAIDIYTTAAPRTLHDQAVRW